MIGSLETIINSFSDVRRDDESFEFVNFQSTSSSTGALNSDLKLRRKSISFRGPGSENGPIENR